MNRPGTAFAIAIVTVVAAPGAALAAPPTVTPSPGYDARLQEQHKANSASTSILVQPAAPPGATATRHRGRRKY